MLRVLDRCLDLLEDAQERDEATVSPRIADALSGHIPSVTVGLPTTEAIDIVLRAQERWLRPAEDGGAGPRPASESVDESGQPLNEEGARTLTDRIKTSRRHLCLLLLEAHDRRAWSALHYRTWARYVRQEFGMSRSRSYELLDQARVALALQKAASVSGIPDISAFAAQEIKPHLDHVLREIRRRTLHVSQRRAMTVVHDVVRETRDRLGAPPVKHPRVLSENGTDSSHGDLDTAPALAPPDWDVARRVQLAIEWLSDMPAAAGVAGQLSDAATLTTTFADIDRAVEWLTDLKQELLVVVCVGGRCEASARC